MDRCTTNIAKSQIGFINFIIKPSYETMHSYLPGIQRMLQGIDQNKVEWENRVDQYEAKMEKEKWWWEKKQKASSKQSTD